MCILCVYGKCWQLVVAIVAKDWCQDKGKGDGNFSPVAFPSVENRLVPSQWPL